jgi:hypothetical protein
LGLAVSSVRFVASISRLGDPLSLSSSVSAFLGLLSTGEEAEDVFRRRAGSYRFMDRRRRFLSRLPLRLRLRLLDGP